jgi:hypothetical protein
MRTIAKETADDSSTHTWSDLKTKQTTPVYLGRVASYRRTILNERPHSDNRQITRYLGYRKQDQTSHWLPIFCWCLGEKSRIGPSLVYKSDRHAECALLCA